MSRLSLLMGLFMAVAVSGIVVLLAIIGNVAAGTIIYRGVLVFFIFGVLGPTMGSFLEVVLMPVITEREAEKHKIGLLHEDAQLQAELGDLLDEDKLMLNITETFGTPTDESWPGNASDGNNSSAAVS